MITIKDKILDLLLIIISIIALIVILPFLIIYYPIDWYNSRNFERKYSLWLKTQNGKNFFCYNNRRKGSDFITSTLIPALQDEIEIIYLKGRKIQLESYEKEFISHAFYAFKNYTKFPHLLKIRNGKTFDCSIHADIFKVINEGKDIELLHNKMKDFFELNK